MTLSAIAIEAAIGESVDHAVEIAPAPGGDPLLDGSVFTLALAAARDAAPAPLLLLSSRDDAAAPRIDLTGFAAGKVAMTLRIPVARIAQLAPGAYVGDLMHERGRPLDRLGAARTRIAVVALTIVGGTGS